MKIGMLWYDNDPKTTITQKIEKAAAYYAKKYGKQPNVCHVLPAMLVGKEPVVDGIEVKGDNFILPNHFWFGVEEQTQAEVAA